MPGMLKHWTISLSILVISSAAAAIPTLDQENLQPGLVGGRIGVLPISGVFDVAQVFEVGISGQLTSVNVFLFRNGSPADLTLDIRTTTAGVPDPAGVLGTVTLGFSAVPLGGGFVSFDLSLAEIDLVQGDELALVLSSPQDFTGNVHEYGVFHSDQSYPRGAQFHGDIDAGTAFQQVPDIVFQTFVEPIPEPSTSLLLAVGVAVLRLCRPLRSSARSLTRESS